MDVTHEHTDFGAQISFLGSEGLYSLFDLKSNLFFCYSKFPIEGCITRTY
jgi:hypothetical protein